MANKFSTNILLVEVVVSTQFGPDKAVQLVKDRLKCPAVENIKFFDVESNFIPHHEPGEMYPLSEAKIKEYNK